MTKVFWLLLVIMTAFGRADFGDELFQLEASDAWVGDGFGFPVSVSDGVAIVGSRSDAAYLVDVTTGDELRKLTSGDEGFGRAVGISGGTAIVSINSGYSGDGPGFEDAAYLFDVASGRELLELRPSGDDPVSRLWSQCGHR